MDKDIQQQVQVVATPWASSPYYEEAERWTHIFWSENSEFYKLFQKLNLSSVLELACGRGRHSEIVAKLAGKLILMDVLQNNIDACKNRLADYKNIEYHKNNGCDFSPIGDEMVTAIFSYDAMVHFTPDIVRSYLFDSARILKNGGMALYHHSNYAGPVKEHYGLHPHARNHMTMEMFSEYCRKAGLQIVESKAISWGGVADLDGLTLVQKQISI